MEISVIYEDDDVIVFDKPAGMPSAPLKKSADAGNPEAVRSAIECLCDARPAVRAVSGYNDREHGLVHRLDTDTRGLLLSAKNREAFDFLVAEQRGGRFEKRYRAFVAESRTRKEGFPPLPENFFIQKTESSASIRCESRFRRWGRGAKEVRPVLRTPGKSRADGKAGKTIYETSIHLDKISIESQLNSILKYTYTGVETGFSVENLLRRLKNHNTFIADSRIFRGFRHQVRAHLAWCGFPVIGDSVYGGESPGGAVLFFYAVSLSFRHPATGLRTEFSLG